MTRLFLVSFAVLSLVACTTDDEPKKKVAQPPPGTGEYSNIGWNRPAKWEGGSRLGNMMPQSR